MRVQEGDTGDYFTMAHTGMDIKSIKTDKKPGEKFDIYVYDSAGDNKHLKQVRMDAVGKVQIMKN